MGDNYGLGDLMLWGMLLIIPTIFELLRNTIFSLILYVKSHKKQNEKLDFFPTVSILVPLYNSRKTLDLCLSSIVNQTYPMESLEVFLLDNGNDDGSYELFQEFQAKHPELKVWYMRTDMGKALALNQGVFVSAGKYIINMDSDGWMDKNAVMNVVQKFEQNPTIACMTGVILIDPDQIESAGKGKIQKYRKAEFIEYIESFVIGRNIQSSLNMIYTLAGAFSCFRREALFRTQLYNSDTLGEDTHMTFQIKKFHGGKVSLCENAFFYVDPIDNLDKLYTQRQRWQRSEIEVARLFSEYYPDKISDIFSNFTIRILIADHTLLFAKLIWLFATIYLYLVNHLYLFIVLSNIVIYTIYLFNTLINRKIAMMYLKSQDKASKYLKDNWKICFFMPIYRMITYFIRMAGIINSINSKAEWKTRTFTQEIEAIKKEIRIFFRIEKP